MTMKLKEVIELVNLGKAKYKFSRFGNRFVGLNENSFTLEELDSNAKGFLKMKGAIFFRKLK